MQALERLLREKEVVMRCVWGEETTGIFEDDGDDEDMGMDESDDEDVEEAEAAMALKEMEKVRAEVAAMSLDDLLSAAWPSFHGVALFRTVARMNHSCRPNVKITFPRNNHAL